MLYGDVPTAPGLDLPRRSLGGWPLAPTSEGRKVLSHEVIPINQWDHKLERQMNKFKIKVARIETTGRDEQERQVCVTFQLDRRPISFQVPVVLSLKDFDDTEMVQAARNALHRIFAELASQSRKWKLTANDLKQLSDLSMRLKS
jgi:hypothetical protein